MAPALKPGYLTESDGKPSNNRRNTTMAIWLGFFLIVLQTAASILGYLKGLPAAPVFVSWETLLLLFGYGGFNAASSKFAESKSDK